MITNSEELEQARMSDPRVVNGVDNANLMSVDSTEPVKITVESLDENGKVLERIPTEEKKEEEAVKEVIEEKKEDEEKVSPEPEIPVSAKVQERINKITKKFRTAERERDFERQQRLELQAKLDNILSKIPNTAKPQKKDFEDEDAYIEALTDWKIESKLKASQNKVVEEVKTKNEKEAVLAVYETLDTVMERGKEKYADFNELAFSADLVLSPDVVNISLDTENPEDVLYYLISNPEESERISSLGEVKAAKEIGRIESKLLGEKKVGKTGDEESKKSAPAAKKQSNAPAPITPIVTTGSVSKDPASMTPKEYRAWRESKK